jgi:XTP/dITP diphosphohydrolase
VAQRDEPVDEVQADTLEEVVQSCIAQLRARGIDNFVLDDSGLFVDALSGFPGVYSSYVFKTIGSEGILKLLAGEKDRSARFRCCVGAHVEGAGELIVIESAEGRIIDQRRGSGGFGYDPIFVPSGQRLTFAELSLDEKNLISHRGKAIKSFSRLLKDRIGVP